MFDVHKCVFYAKLASLKAGQRRSFGDVAGLLICASLINKQYASVISINHAIDGLLYRSNGTQKWFAFKSDPYGQSILCFEPDYLGGVREDLRRTAEVSFYHLCGMCTFSSYAIHQLKRRASLTTTSPWLRLDPSIVPSIIFARNTTESACTRQVREARLSTVKVSAMYDRLGVPAALVDDRRIAFVSALQKEGMEVADEILEEVKAAVSEASDDDNYWGAMTALLTRSFTPPSVTSQRKSLDLKAALKGVINGFAWRRKRKER